MNIFDAITCGQKTMHFMESRLIHKSFTLDKYQKVTLPEISTNVFYTRWLDINIQINYQKVRV